MEIDSDLGVAMLLADEAGRLAAAYFERPVIAELKADGTPVADADHAVERLLRARLAEIRPGDAVLGEEFGQAGTAERTWIIDPIDGTDAFAAGHIDWRIHVALEVAAAIVVAVVVAPALGLRWWATAGEGAFEGPWPAADGPVTRLAVTTTAALAEARIEAWPLEGELGPLEDVAGLPTAVVPVAVARGTLDAFVVDCCHAWDHAPWILITVEAGGRFSDWAGGETPHQRGGVFSNGGIHDELLASMTFPHRVDGST